ncbi:Lrp/AsnC family transcriptional regulator [Kineococcus sp. NUM-3379]
MSKDLRATTARARRSRVDAVDRELIAHLQEDGRKSYAALAKAVGLSEAAVRQRVQRLLEGGVMQVVAVTDPMTVNLLRQTMIGIRVDGDTRTVAARLAELPEVDYVVLCAGSFDIICELTCRDDEELLVLLNTHVRVIPGVRSTETFIYLELVKQTYAWGGGPSAAGARVEEPDER